MHLSILSDVVYTPLEDGPAIGLRLVLSDFLYGIELIIRILHYALESLVLLNEFLNCNCLNERNRIHSSSFRL